MFKFRNISSPLHNAQRGKAEIRSRMGERHSNQATPLAAYLRAHTRRHLVLLSTPTLVAALSSAHTAQSHSLLLALYDTSRTFVISSEEKNKKAGHDAST